MGTFELLAAACLIFLAAGDLIVGVVNDAVNFMNSAIGSKVATRRIILLVAGLGLIIGATFSDGIIEVARKGIFNPGMFTLAEAVMLFTAVAIADIILLDLYSSFGLPTSTTVSVVFELLGAALILAFWKFGSLASAWEVINSATALKIVLGILLSIVISFSVAIVVQFITRFIFSFDYKKQFQKWGALWSGVAMTSLVFFILFKGSSHATFMTPELKQSINENVTNVILFSFVSFTALSFIALRFFRLNILKIIVLIGTGALAMAFAGNDLANFIGVSVAGVNAFLGADLTGKLPTPTWVVLAAGIVMSVTLFLSKKANTVTETEIALASHSKTIKNHWKANIVVEKFVANFSAFFEGFKKILPARLLQFIKQRWETDGAHRNEHDFDIMRAAVNVMTAAALISVATSYKLPLSTTYVTFMVAMGTALADGAWDRDCAAYRITGVATVVGGWFVTAAVAFTMAGITVTALYFGRTIGLITLLCLVAVIMWKLVHVHKRQELKRRAANSIEAVKQPL
ncbi:phosphate transporter family protein [Candidatus Peregrinibacteria bacterium CG11_big_fil_rev_8_21_14_0_20_46_8]|nr:MAG: phosphate transporter family protein [Candidatus Peregrinibacteria bacterium CG11_big_fil_rev_8_21_14_0_20_46_8]